MNTSHPTDDSSAGTSASLVQRVRSNDANAWQRLVDLYGPLIFTWACRGGLSPEDAADVMQEVFASVARAIKRFDPAAEGRFRGWLWTITRNKIHDHFRRASPQGAQGLNATGGDTALRMLNQLPEHWDDDSSAATRNDVLALYHRAMQLIRNDFESQTWQAFWMAVVEERTTDEIARSLGMSTNSVRQAKSRVLRRLKQELSDAR
ncbi:RNA polymerase sigma factor [Stieleria varia]|uniref:ECF RNA polymerase sigma factor SigE n=1 Tax=Stieleria varia TaxID=2528005 RepID=A0A5C6A5N3_9BACT|nr:sigma-70 family RNA polymerase sigma factor [Stieleria varia]TWT94618.1 ECF RNA polymerase sigma factor SigE [Stieleria varia]